MEHQHPVDQPPRPPQSPMKIRPAPLGSRCPAKGWYPPWVLYNGPHTLLCASFYDLTCHASRCQSIHIFSCLSSDRVVERSAESQNLLTSMGWEDFTPTIFGKHTLAHADTGAVPVPPSVDLRHVNRRKQQTDVDQETWAHAREVEQRVREATCGCIQAALESTVVLPKAAAFEG